MPLRICLLSYRSNPHCGGQGVYIRNLSCALKNLGHDVDVIAGPPAAYLPEGVGLHQLPSLDLYSPENLFRTPSLKELSHPINLLEWLGMTTMGFPEPFTFGIRAYQFLRKRLGDYDIIHDNQNLSYGVWALSRLCPTIATIHHPITVDRDLAVNTVRAGWKKFKAHRWHSFIGMQKRVARHFSHIITVSECSRVDIARDYIIPQKKFRIVPNGIDTNVFFPIPETKREQNRIITTNSADMALKGLYHLLRAVAMMAAARPIHLVVIGTPKKKGGIVKLIRKLGIKDLITFTGRISNAEFVRQYARASVAVVPSLYEGFGLPVGEAMACAVPVVSTTGGALPEVMGQAGLLVPPGDEQALAAAISKILDNPTLAAKLGHAGYERVHRLFTWEKAAQITVKVYKEAIMAHLNKGLIKHVNK